MKRLQPRLWVVTCTLALTFGYFYPGGGWNQNSRLDLTRAIVEERTFRIDSFHDNTGDKAYFEGHYYSDKAPGLSLLAVPVWAVAREAARLLGKDPNSSRSVNTGLHVMTLAVVGLPTALAAACMLSLSLKFGSSISGATVGALAFGVGTPMWCYATLFWGHATAAAFLVFAFAAAIRLHDAGTRKQMLVTALALGVTAGWATVVEYPSAIPASIIALLGIRGAARHDRSSLLATTVGIAGGALVSLFALISYTVAAFGSPFHVGYLYEVNFQQEITRGILGFGIPPWNVIRQLLVGWHRGLLFLSPFLIVAPIGLYYMWRRTSFEVATVVVAVIPLYYLLLASSFNAWEAGWTFGPRYMSPALPFLCLPIAALWPRVGTVGRAILWSLIVYGAVLSFIAVSTSPTPPDSYERPLQEFLWPAFVAGRVPAVPVPNSWNLGNLAGLKGHTALLPLLLLWAVAFIVCRRLERYVQLDTERGIAPSRYRPAGVL